jgi:hypothetical protein
MAAADGGVVSPERSLLDRRVVVAFLLQVVGYAALLAVFPHSEPAAVVETLRRLPTVLLVVAALPPVPALALALALAVGGALSLVGLPPESLPALLLARDDVLFFASALTVPVASAWVLEYRPV